MAHDQDGDWQFPHFMELPLELREQIWEACLPFRVRELDEYYYPDEPSLYGFDDHKKGYIAVCSARQTSVRNTNPPTITTVCHESRKVALRNVDRDDCMGKAWLDLRRDSPHNCFCTAGQRYWPESDLPFTKNALHDLAKAVTADTAPGSFMIQMLSTPLSEHDLDKIAGSGANADNPSIYSSPRRYPSEELRQKYAALTQHAEWLVVMDIIVLHCTAEAIATKLFGVYGYAPIQIIPTTERRKIDGLYDLLQKTDGHEDVQHRQNYKRYTNDEWYRIMHGLVWDEGFPNELVHKLRPAIMFRLCHDGCNRKDDVEHEHGWRGRLFVRPGSWL